MFDPAKLSPLPWHFEEWADEIVDIDNVADNVGKDDAEFFVMARKCYDIGERRGWYVQNVGGRRWCANFNATNGDDPDERFHELVPTQADAMALMIEADEWLTKQETEGNSDEC